jgi:glycerol kinase
MDYVLAIDQGTHASRALLFDHRGRAVASHLQHIDLKRSQANHVEQDANQILTSVTTSVQQVLQALPAGLRSRVASCGLTTQRSTVVAWQKDGKPRSPALSWQDTRGSLQIDRLHTRADRIRQLSGLPLSAHYGASKLHWLCQSLGDTRDLHLGPLATFLLNNLTANPRSLIDHSNAQRMQLLDIQTCNWSQPLLDWFEVPLGVLPDCTAVEHDYGTLMGQGIPLTAVCGDQNAAWFGAGQPDTDSAQINIGSGAFILAAHNDSDLQPALLKSIASSHGQSVEYLTEGTVNGAGSALHWLQQQYGIDDLDQRLPEWLDTVTDPPLFMNTVGGLGSPWWQPELSPAFHPDNPAYSPAERAVAVAESILFLLQANLDHLQRQHAVSRLRVSGGLSRVTTLCQKLANLAGLPVIRSDNREASARGVAWLAAGRPAHWQSDEGAQLFEPRFDGGLTSRYQRFIQQLQTYIETTGHD